MKKVFAIFTIVFAFTILSAAQAGSASGSAQAGAGDQAAQKKASPKKGAAGSTTLTGCLSGPNDEGVYELKSSKKEVEVGGLDDLSKHVGHKVRLHGSWTKNGSDIGEKESSESKGKEEKGERHFKVASIDHISDTCAAGAAEKGEHHKKGTSQPSSAQAVTQSRRAQSSGLRFSFPADAAPAAFADQDIHRASARQSAGAALWSVQFRRSGR